MLHCICPKWQRAEERFDELSSRSEYGLVPLDSIREFVHIVDRNTIIASIKEGEERLITHFETSNGTETWENETLYVNGCFSNGVKEFEIVESQDTL